MKKFLSVLLAVAVAFTFTFGSCMSAFAASAVGSATTEAEKYAAAKTELEGTCKAAIEKLASEYKEDTASVTNIVVPKAVYAEIAQTVYNDYMNVLTIAYNKGEVATVTNITDGAARDGMKYADVDTVDEFVNLVVSNGQTAYKNAALIKNIENYKDAAKAEIAKINTGLYTADQMVKNDPYKMTYQAFAEKVKSDKTTAVSAVTLNEYSTTAQINKAYKDVKDQLAGLTIVTSYVDAKGNTVALTYKVAGTYDAGTYGSETLKTKDELGIADAQDTALQNTLKAEVTTNANAYYKDAVDASYGTVAERNAAIAAAKTAADNYTAVMNCRIEEGVVVSSPVTALSASNAADFNTAVANYEKLVAKANELKVAVDAAGKLIYDAAKIDKNLELGKIAIYTTSATDYDLTTKASAKAADLDWAKAEAVAAVEEERDYGTTGYVGLKQADGTENYYAPEAEKITAIYAAVIEKINATTSIEQLDTINTSVYANNASKPEFSKTKAQVETDIQNLAKFAGELASLNTYASYINGSKKTWEDGYKAPLTAAELAKVYAEKGARTNDEIVALAAEAKAAFDAKKTNKEIAEAKKAVEDLVNAIPAYITADAKTAIKAAYDASVEFGGTIDNASRLNSAISQIKAIDEKAMDDALAALPAKLTAANKDAVNALVAAVEAYESDPMYKTGSAFATYAKASDVTKAFNAVREAVRNDVMAAIAALSETSTKEQVAAARAAYDAFVAEYQDASKGYDAKSYITNMDKLTVLEAGFATPAYTDKDAKAYILDMKVTAAAKKVTKTKAKMTVKVNVTELKDNGYTVTYKYYVKAPGKKSYKLKKTSTKKSYTFTKLAKGKNTFKVKIIVKNADGTTVGTKTKTKTYTRK